MGSTVFKRSLIAVAVSINMFALTRKFSTCKLSGILTPFREDIDAEAISTVAFQALTIGNSREDQQQNCEELECFLHGTPCHVLGNALERISSASSRARFCIKTFLLRPCLPLFIETVDFGTPKRSAKK